LKESRTGITARTWYVTMSSLDEAKAAIIALDGSELETEVLTRSNNNAACFCRVAYVRILTKGPLPLETKVLTRSNNKADAAEVQSDDHTVLLGASSLMLSSDRGRRKKQGKEVTGEEEIQQIFRAEVLVFIKDMDKDTGILMGSRVLDVRRLPDKVGCSGRRRRQASLLFLKALQHTYNAEDHHIEKVKDIKMTKRCEKLSSTVPMGQSMNFLFPMFLENKSIMRSHNPTSFGLSSK
ncbi:hypothetical protein Tco_0722168, partial [Tanacetum coccineum]